MKNYRYSLKELVAENEKPKFDYNLVILSDFWDDEDLSLFDAVALSNIHIVMEKMSGSLVTTKKSFISFISNLMGCSQRSAERFLNRMLESDYIIIVNDENAIKQGFVRYIDSMLSSNFYDFLSSRNDDIDLEPWMQAYLDFPISDVIKMLNGGN